MRRDLQRRLETLEAKRQGRRTAFDPCWLNLGDGFLRNGEMVMTEEAFRKAFPNCRQITLKLGEIPLAATEESTMSTCEACEAAP
jgi:hypothetical protein